MARSSNPTSVLTLCSTRQLWFRRGRLVRSIRSVWKKGSVEDGCKVAVVDLVRCSHEGMDSAEALRQCCLKNSQQQTSRWDKDATVAFSAGFMSWLRTTARTDCWS